jgi:branched-chain amino acid transport system permease protein
VFGVLVGIPALRVEGLYRVIATFAFAEIVRLFFLNFEYRREVGGEQIGPQAEQGFRFINAMYVDLGLDTRGVLVLILALLAGVVAFAAWLRRSRFGRQMRAIGEDEQAAAAAGVHTTRVKVTAFSVGAAIAGLGGGLFAHYSTFIDQANFGLAIGVLAIAFVLIGGTGSVFGPLVGVAFYLFVLEFFRFLGPYRLVMFGVAIVVVMLVRPYGFVDIRVQRWVAGNVTKVGRRIARVGG